jgi:HSP20 family protein
MARSADLLLEGRDLLDPFAVGLWTPPVDICQTESRVLVRIELPGVELSDVSLTFQGESLRIRGVKREQVQSRKLLCFYCLERRYGRFDRQIAIKGVLNPRMSRSCLEKGILTVEIPTVKDRRGETVELQIEKK